MNQLITAIILKLDKKYPDKGLKGLINDESTIKWVKKTGLLNKSVEELFNRLSLDDREELLTKLFVKLYPKGGISKHPKHRVWLMKLGDDKFFYEVEADKVTMPMGRDEPRVFPAARFAANLPKLEEFIQYLSDYSMRQRRRFKL